jgi:hypothetical protein
VHRHDRDDVAGAERAGSDLVVGRKPRQAEVDERVRFRLFDAFEADVGRFLGGMASASPRR